MCPKTPHSAKLSLGRVIPFYGMEEEGTYQMAWVAPPCVHARCHAGAALARSQFQHLLLLRARRFEGLSNRVCHEFELGTDLGLVKSQTDVEVDG